MKLKKVVMLSFIFIIISVISIGCSFNKLLTNDNEKSDTSSSTEAIASSNSDLSFVVLGDIHDNIDNFQNAVDDFYKINPKTDAWILNGDTVDQGKDEQYDSVKEAINKDSKKLPDIIIKNLGNHEFYNYDMDSNSKADIDNFTNKYLDFAGTDKVYHDMWIKGYHFISLGSDNINSEDLNTTQASLSKEQISWLKDKLQENYEEGKPIFVFLHQPISTDFFGNQWYGVKQGDELMQILSQYPEVIIFSSHTHKDFTGDSVQEDMPFTMVHTGAVGYTFVKDNSSDNGRKRDNSKNNGLYIEVTGDKVTLNARDIENYKWVYTKDIDKSI